ncbi:acyl-CoA thioesterase [Rhodococcus pyridinivorans SB3094]|uniref:Acyl-CoA thioesterase n=1 Tax=Rhodococcus pyridinivorans SB3094 TaxID=1435356 RepID=V9XD40_9NOCA|nr:MULTISPECIES: thioesterase family protein [Rhodococcus]AHD19247.1 acyl-CoA thioesterase [Rhodococcus pyridinivorans SB3094]MCT7290147.1 thioesterase family protein [Rhodococcus sp. PAE-6]
MTDVSVTTHVFDAAVDLFEVRDDRTEGHTHPAYANMVGPFGGITAATLLRAVERHPDVLGMPLSLTVNYAGPIADGPFDIAVRPVRTNRTTQHWSIELSQGGEVATTATAVFGLRRPTWSSTELQAPAAPAPDSLEPTPLPDFIAWARNYEMRYTAGVVPEEGSAEVADSTSTLWVRDVPSRPLDFASLTAMCDIFYPRAFLRLGRVLPAGTVSMTVYFYADPETVAAQSDSPVLATARANRFEQGFFDQSAQLWGRDGVLLATSHQIVYFKA